MADTINIPEKLSYSEEKDWLLSLIRQETRRKQKIWYTPKYEGKMDDLSECDALINWLLFKIKQLDFSKKRKKNNKN